MGGCHETQMVFTRSAVLCSVTAGVRSGRKDDIGIEAGNLNYVFGPKNGLIRIEDLSGNIVYDFGERPCWFMLTYMFQYGSIQNPRTEGAYFYPQLGDLTVF